MRKTVLAILTILGLVTAAFALDYKDFPLGKRLRPQSKVLTFDNLSGYRNLTGDMFLQLGNPPARIDGGRF